MTQTLGYDELDRLKTVASTADNESFNYDADGNRTSGVVNGASTTYTTPSTSNRLGSVSGGTSATYGYDAQGNLTTIGGSTVYAYGPFGELASAGGLSYQHGADSQRLLKTGAPGTTYFAPDAGGTLLAEEQGSTWMDYVWLNGRLVNVIANGGVFSLHDDQTGRPQVMTAPTGNSIDWAARNAAFDRTVTTNAWGAFNIGFPGQYLDSESGLWQNGYRDYNASLGRYVESDPIGLAAGINTYSYARNNPINNIDPLGQACHHYNVSVFTLCSAAQAMSMVMAPGNSAPGAPAVQADNLSRPITLSDTPFSSQHGNNRILQSVDFSAMTITNVTLSTHVFFPGQLVWQFTPGPLGVGSFISVTGTGSGANWAANDAAGLLFFGGVEADIAGKCAAMAAMGL